MSSSSGSGDEDVEVIKEAEEIISSGEDPPRSQWSSLESLLVEENKKKILYNKGLYSPGSGEICAKYLTLSDSSVFRHVYYNYPAVLDPGIKEALLAPEKPVIYPDDGQELYLSLCEEMNKCPVRLFYKNLLSKVIDLKYYCVDPFGVRAMAMALQYNKYVQRLDLTDNFLNDDACYHLGRMLQFNYALKELILSGCRIGPSGLACLMENIKTNKCLTTLDLSRNELCEEGGVYIANQLGAGVSVPIINLSKNQLGRLTAVALAEALEFRNKLTQFDLSLNNFYQVTTTAKMLNSLSNSRILTNLNLAWNAMEGEKIAEAIKNILKIPSLAVLNLSNNRFYGLDVSTIASTLYKAKKLITLDFSRNPLSPDDAQILIDKMKKPSVKLRNLLLENVDVSRQFLITLDNVKNMKSRSNFFTVYGHVRNNWVIAGPDTKKLILERAAYLGTKEKKRKVDIPLFFLRLHKNYPEKPMQIKELLDIVSAENVPLDENLLTEICNVFPGGKAKMKALDIASVCDYIKRLWPEKRLPPTPPPEAQPEPPPPPPPPAKGKGKQK